MEGAVNVHSLTSWKDALSNPTSCGRFLDQWVIVSEGDVDVLQQCSGAFYSALLANPQAVFLYADHECFDAETGTFNPLHLPGWSLEHLRSKNYIGSAFVVRTDHLAKLLGAANEDLSKATEEHLSIHGWHDLILRLTETLPASQIVHLPEVLFRLPSISKNLNAVRCGTSMMAVVEHLKRMGIEAEVEQTPHGFCRVSYVLPTPEPLVSILIPTRDQPVLLKKCLESILEKSSYLNFEILVIDNRSRSSERLQYLQSLHDQKKIRVLHDPSPFNFSALNNLAANQAYGEILCLLNDDTEVLSPDWLETMIGHLMQPGVGVVGAKLLYPNETVQHAGDAVGVRGAADHLHSGIGSDEPGYGDRAVVAQDLSAVTGACLMTHRDLYLELGGLDAINLPVAYNDTDYCLRVREVGRRVLWTPHARLIHHELASRGRKRSVWDMIKLLREKKYFQHRWLKENRLDPFYGRHFNKKRADFS